jgi:nickel-dependent lactate racemase
MRNAMDCGRQRLEFEVAEGNRIACPSPPPPLADPAAAVRAALEEPFGFPPLRRALTPDDHIAIVLDERLPRLPELLTPLLEHVTGAGVAPERITLLCPPSASRQPWLEDLPDAFEEVRLEVHDPADRKRLSYLATTRQGKRLYLNRTVVDADQVVVLSGRAYDPLLGYAGAEGAVYPTLGDDATRAEMNARGQLAAPDATWPVRREAVETAWLLGAPFLVQAVAAAGDELAEVVAGAAEAGAEGLRRQDACWRWPVDRSPDVVVAGLAGDPSRQTFADLAAAAACAARVVQPGGRIALLCQARPDLGGAEVLRAAEGPREVLDRLRGQGDLDLVPALRWAGAAQHARLYLMSALDEEAVEDLFATPLRKGGEVQRLLDAGGSCLFLQDAHKALVIVQEP